MIKAMLDQDVINKIFIARSLQTQPSLIIKYINHEKHIVYIGAYNLFYLTTEKDDSGTEKPVCWRCSMTKFMGAYPEKWQEIQVELALRKLKNS